MEGPLQYQETAQFVGLPPTCPRNHRSDSSQAGHALTFELDHSRGPDYSICRMVYRGHKRLIGTVILAGFAAGLAGVFVTDKINSISSRAPHQYTEKKEKYCLKSKLIGYEGRQSLNAGNKDLTESTHEEYLIRIQEECGNLSTDNFEEEAIAAIGEVHAKLVQLYRDENQSSLDLETQVRSITATLTPLADQYTLRIKELESTPEFKRFVSEIPRHVDELRVEYVKSWWKNSAIIFPFSFLLVSVGHGLISRRRILRHPYIR